MLSESRGGLVIVLHVPPLRTSAYMLPVVVQPSRLDGCCQTVTENLSDLS